MFKCKNCKWYYETPFPNNCCIPFYKIYHTLRDLNFRENVSELSGWGSFDLEHSNREVLELVARNSGRHDELNPDIILSWMDEYEIWQEATGLDKNREEISGNVGQLNRHCDCLLYEGLSKFSRVFNNIFRKR